jgi:hypothetical protein
VVIALSLGYYFIKKAGGAGFWPKEKATTKDIIIEEKEFDPESKNQIVERKKVLKEQSSTASTGSDASGVYPGAKVPPAEKQPGRKPGQHDDNSDKTAK